MLGQIKTFYSVLFRIKKIKRHLQLPKTLQIKQKWKISPISAQNLTNFMLGGQNILENLRIIYSHRNLILEGFSGSLNPNIVTATLSEVPSARGGQYQRRTMGDFRKMRRLLEFQEKLTTHFVQNLHSGFFSVAEHEYRDGNAPRGIWEPGWPVSTSSPRARYCCTFQE
ncbi:hypothetical protein TSAR_009756 [Trichomalopsis sarcophagae]|uniref:Uncharacterized protein n=1 Tax=Trichomalopsis sarcophagae TaxID=543379 RepID=A0A232EH83_9HYME|nr:hypothetical protein TSAR_009756 [Trichomalopsis sarcophagae]